MSLRIPSILCPYFSLSMIAHFDSTTLLFWSLAAFLLMLWSGQAFAKLSAVTAKFRKFRKYSWFYLICFEIRSDSIIIIFYLILSFYPVSMIELPEYVHFKTALSKYIINMMYIYFFTGFSCFVCYIWDKTHVYFSIIIILFFFFSFLFQRNLFSALNFEKAICYVISYTLIWLIYNICFINEWHFVVKCVK